MRSHYTRLFCIPWRATLNDEIFIDATSWMAVETTYAHTHTRTRTHVNINEKEREGKREREREGGTRVAGRRRSRIKVLLRCFFVTAFALLLRSPGTMTNPRHHCAGPCSSRKMQKREESPQKGEREIGKGIRRVTITRRWLHGPLCKDNGVRDDKRVSPLSLCQGSEMILMSGWKGEGTR